VDREFADELVFDEVLDFVGDVHRDGQMRLDVVAELAVVGGGPATAPRPAA
jgi:hypothetical protein